MRPLGYLFAITLVPGGARADTGVRIGPHAGVQLRDSADPSVGAELRLSFPLSPLTIMPAFDYIFDTKRTLYEISVSALYYLPVPIRWMDPYLGVGFNVTSFSFKEHTTTVDENGNRLGMSLTAGACLAVPAVAPFVQVVKEIGEFDPVSISAGVVVALDRDPRWDGCGRSVR